MNKNLRKLLAFVPALLWYRVIWGFSAQTAVQSGGASDGLLHTLLSIVVPAYRGAAAEVQTVAVETLSFFLRKGAHMTCYFILSALLLAACSLWVKPIYKRCGLVVALCALLAGLDEYHQTFVPGRSGQLRDVCIDVTGGVIALVLWLVLRWLWTAKKEDRRPTLVMGGLACLCVVLAVALPAAFAQYGQPFVQWMSRRFVEDWSRYDQQLQQFLIAGVTPIVAQTLKVCLLLAAVVFVLLACLPLAARWLHSLKK